MADYSQQWNTAAAVNMHSSNPEPFTWTELNELIGFDPLSSLRESSLDYTSSQGGVELREIIVKQFHTGAVKADDVVLTSGAQEGIFVVMNALLEAGDQVIGFSPCFEPLCSVAKEAGVDVTMLPLDPLKHWRINWEQLEATISHKTKLVIINFPHNPTGAHLTENELIKLINLCEKHDCWLFSDEVFRGLEHDTNDQLPAAVDLYHKAISMGVMSKSMALPGIRLGWLISRDQNLKHTLMQVKSYLSICQSALDTQVAQVIIPHSDSIFERNRNIITHNKQWLNQRLVGHEELYWQPPKAAATGFIQFKDCDADKRIKHWLDKYHFMVMPGQAFLSSSSGFRLTLGQRNSRKYYQKIIEFN